MVVYFVFVLGIGFALKRYMQTSNDFFLAGRAIPAWICGLAFISANLGAQEVIGMADDSGQLSNSLAERRRARGIGVFTQRTTVRKSDCVVPPTGVSGRD